MTSTIFWQNIVLHAKHYLTSLKTDRIKMCIIFLCPFYLSDKRVAFRDFILFCVIFDYKQRVTRWIVIGLTFSTLIPEVIGSNFPWKILVFGGFLPSLRANIEIWLRLEHGNFLSNPFQLSSHVTQITTLCDAAYDNVGSKGRGGGAVRRRGAVMQRDWRKLSGFN
jgi:hypothetical protein